MNISSLLAVTLLLNFIPSLAAKAISVEKTEVEFQKHGIDPEQYRELFAKQASDWQTLAPKEKELAVKGTIISLEMETSGNDALLEQHTQASIQCMDTKGHGLNLAALEDMSLPLVTCITDAYKK